MPSLKISELAPGAPAQSTDVIPIERAGANLSLTAQQIADLSAGDLAALNQAPSWFDNSEGSPFSHNAASGGNFGNGIANKVTAFMFRLLFPFTFNTISFFINAGVAGLIGIGVYDTGGNLLIHWDSISGLGAGSATVATPTGGPVTLPPGVYFWAFAFSTNSVGNPTTNGSLATEGSNSNTMPYNKNVTRAGTAANLMVAGVLPATLGALTAGVNAAMPIWTVETI